MNYLYSKEINIKNLDELVLFSKKLNSNLINGDTVLLSGDLGAGKTTLVKYVAKENNVKDKVISPTFNIMKIYLSGERPIVHIDAYRLNESNIDIGLEEYIGTERGLTFIEWPYFIEKYIPLNNILIEIYNPNNDDSRLIVIKTNKLDILKDL
ncbi:MAG: tRNA (adenosine(37)-N6)-threonylcarbamoyltransferase complex ATPase subunit type 1 TsaE [Bacilli bacterium]